jgi:hypothetical protein
MEAPERPVVTRTAVVLQTGPHPAGFLTRYLLAFTPLVLLGVSVIMTGLMRDVVRGSLSPILHGTAGSILAGMGIGELIEISILLTAPVGIYLSFVIIGWMIRSTEMWAGSAIALGLGTVWGIALMGISPETSLSQGLELLTWITSLMGPASVVATLMVIAWIDFSRRSTRYTITRENLVLKGGIWRKQEHVLPWHQIGRLVMEQNPVERLFNTGTIIPVAAGSPGPAGRRGGGLAGAGREISRSPLDCLCGVREPGLVMEFLQELVTRSRETGQETPLKEEGPESQ